MGGIVRPSALAVLRLMTNSTFVDCCTGRSPGFCPLERAQCRALHPAPPPLRSPQSSSGHPPAQISENRRWPEPPGWWQDLNLRPPRPERCVPSVSHWKISVFHGRLCAFVTVCSRFFCPIWSHGTWPSRDGMRRCALEVRMMVAVALLEHLDRHAEESRMLPRCQRRSASSKSPRCGAGCEG